MLKEQTERMERLSPVPVEVGVASASRWELVARAFPSIQANLRPLEAARMSDDELREELSRLLFISCFNLIHSMKLSKNWRSGDWISECPRCGEKGDD